MYKLRSLVILIVSCMIFSLLPHDVLAERSTLSIYVNDSKLEHAEAISQHETVYLPFRAIFENLGYTFNYDAENKSIKLWIGEDTFIIYLDEDMIEFSEGMYYLDKPIEFIQQRSYFPREVMEEVFKIAISHNVINNKVDVKELDYAHEKTLKGLVNSYYNRSLSPRKLFTADVSPYGPIETNEFYDTVLSEPVEIDIGEFLFSSVTEASVTTNYESLTPAIKKKLVIKLNFRKENNSWKISKIDHEDYKVSLLEDTNQKEQALLQNSPKEVAKVIGDLKNYYDANNGTDYEAAIQTYSPLHIKYWNSMTTSKLEEIIKHSIMYPNTKRELKEARVLYISDKIAAVYVRVLHTELPQTYGGTVEFVELDEAFEYEDILYMDHTDGERWTYYEEEPLNILN